MAAPSSGVSVEWRNSHERGELAAIEAPKFRQLGDEGSCRNRSYAGHGGEKLLSLSPGRRSTHAGVDVAVNLGEFLF